MASVTLKEIAAALGISKQAAQKRADKAAWPYTEKTCRGGVERLYDLDALPIHIGQLVRLRQLLPSLHRDVEAEMAQLKKRQEALEELDAICKSLGRLL